MPRIPAKTDRLNTVLYNLAETLRLIGLVLTPVMPGTTLKMAMALGSTEDEHSRQNLVDHGIWGLTVPGGKINLGHSLFPRLEKKVKTRAQEVQKKKKKSSPKSKAEGVAPGSKVS